MYPSQTYVGLASEFVSNFFSVLSVNRICVSYLLELSRRLILARVTDSLAGYVTVQWSDNVLSDSLVENKSSPV